MASKEQPPKLFDVEEANRLLPQVQRLLGKLRGCQRELNRLDKEKAVQELSWLREDGSISPQAKEAVTRLQHAIEERGREMESALEEMTKLGAQLKDLEEGLVDFFTARADTLVYLCWKEGEPEIRYWHTLESGFAGRRPIEELSP